MPLQKVYAGQDALHTHYNNMVDFLQDDEYGHDHSGNHDGVDWGKKVKHADLVNPGTHPHTGTGLANTLDWHMDAAQGSGDHTLHGLPWGAYAAGNYGRNIVFEAGYHQMVEANEVQRYEMFVNHWAYLGWILFVTPAMPLAKMLGYVASHCKPSTRNPDSTESYNTPLIYRPGSYTLHHRFSHDGGSQDWDYALVVPAGQLAVVSLQWTFNEQAPHELEKRPDVAWVLIGTV